MIDPLQTAVGGLLAIFEGKPPELAYVWDGQQRDLDVVDGPVLMSTDEPRQLGIGSAAQYVLVAGRGQDRMGYGGRSEWQLDVSCQLLAWSGDTVMAAARAAAAETLAGIRRLLAANRDLDGAVGLARLLTWAYKPLQVEQQGAATQVELVVRINGTTFDDDE